MVFSDNGSQTDQGVALILLSFRFYRRLIFHSFSVRFLFLGPTGDPCDWDLRNASVGLLRRFPDHITRESGPLFSGFVHDFRAYCTRLGVEIPSSLGSLW